MRISLSFLIFFWFISCTSLSLNYFNSGTVRMASKPDAVKSTYLLGFIENRDSHFDPFSTKNLASMLRFSLLNSGYGILNLEDYVKSTEDPNAAKSKLLEQPSNEPSKALLGASLPAGQDLSSRILKESEIKAIGASANFDYLIQGAIAMSDNRRMLDKAESGMIFLEIFDKSGKIVRSINYTIEGKTLSEAELLHSVCSRIIDRLDNKEEKRPWWKF